MKRHHLLFLGIFFLVLFTLFSRYIKQGDMRGNDFAFTVKVQERIDNSSRLRLARFTGEIMEGATFLASPLVTTLAMLFITIVIFLKQKKWRIIVLIVPIMFGLMTLAEIYGKSVVHHPAPPFFLLKNPTTVFPKYYVWEDYSYPSGHAARAAFLAIVLFITMKQFDNGTKRKSVWIAFGLGIYVGLIAISRIYLGHHWLSDVIGGMLLGAGSGLLTNWFMIPYNRQVMKD